MAASKNLQTSSKDLQESGILSISNFTIWKARMDAKLRIHGYDIFPTDEYCSHSHKYNRKQWANMSRRTAHIMQVDVDPALLNRIEAEDQEDAKRLMTRLQELAFQFRFTDLPAELRCRIYEYVIDDDVDVHINPPKGHNSGFPAITRASRLLRVESLPIFMSRAVFDFTFDSGNYSNDRNYDVTAAIQSWARKLTKAQRSSLKAIMLTFRVNNRSSRGGFQTISFKLTEKKTISVHYDSNLSQESKALLDKHAKAAEKDRRMFKFTGHGLILAILSGARLWQWGSLQWA